MARTSAFVSNTINNLTFTTSVTNYITLSGGALFGNEINATAAKFGTISAGNTLIPSDAYTVEDKITDAIDDGSLGFIRLRSGHVYVTPNSVNSPTTTVASIARGHGCHEWR